MSGPGSVRSGRAQSRSERQPWRPPDGCNHDECALAGFDAETWRADADLLRLEELVDAAEARDVAIVNLAEDDLASDAHP
jgi:hypothetical protein